MAGSIKEYVIKITADVKKAQEEIDALGKSLLKVDPKSGFDADITKQTEKITGSVGKLKQEIGDLKNQFGDISVNQLSEEFKKLSKDFTTAIDKMRESFDGFQKSFSVLSGKDSIGGVFDDFTNQMKTMLDSYKTTMSTIEGIGTGAIQQKDVIKSFKKVTSVGDTSIENSADFTEQQLKNTTDSLKKAAKKFYNERARIFKALENPEKYNQGDFVDFDGILKTLSHYVEQAKERGIEFQSILSQFGAGDEETIKKMKKSVDNVLGEYFDAQDANIKKQSELEAKRKNRRPITIPIDVVLNPEQTDDKAVSSMVKEIQDKIQKKVQAQLQKNPVKIPLAFASALSEKEVEGLTDTEISEKLDRRSSEEGIIKTLQLSVEMDKTKLKQTIQEAIDTLGEETPKIHVKVVADMDKESIKNTVFDIENAIENKNKLYGREGIPASSSTDVTSVTLGATGGLATETMQGKILAAIQSLSIDGVKLSNGELPKASESEKKDQNQTYDNDDIVEKNLRRQLSLSGRSHQLTKSKEQELEQTRYSAAMLIEEKERYAQLKEMESALRSSKKSFKDIEKSSLYTRSYFDANGVERAWYGTNNETLEVWQKKLRRYFDAYKSEVDKALNGPIVKDEKGNIVSEGVNHRFDRIKNSTENISYLGKTMKEWQKVLIEDKERSLDSDSTEKILRENRQQAKVLRDVVTEQMEREFTGEETETEKRARINERIAQRIRNEQLQRYEKSVLSTTTMTDDFEKEFKRIRNNAISSAKNRVLSDSQLLSRIGMEHTPFYTAPSATVRSSKNRVDMILENLGLDSLSQQKRKYDERIKQLDTQIARETDASKKRALELQRGKLVNEKSDVIRGLTDPNRKIFNPNKMKAANPGEGITALSNVLDALAEEQAPKLKEALSNLEVSTSHLSDMREYVDLYEKHASGEEFSQEQSSRLRELHSQLSSSASLFLKPRDDLSEIEQVIYDYEKDYMESLEKNKPMENAKARKEAYDKAKERLETYTSEPASLEEVYQYATQQQGFVEKEVKANRKKVKQLRNITREAAEKIAGGTEELQYAVTGTEEQYKAKEKELETKRKRIAKLQENMDFYSGTGAYDRSTLTSPQRSEYNRLLEDVNTLETQQFMWRKIHEQKEDELETTQKISAELQKQKESVELTGKAHFKNLHLQEDTNKEYSQLTRSNDKEQIKNMSSEEMSKTAEVYARAAKEMGKYLEASNVDYASEAEKLVAKDIDDLEKEKQSYDKKLKRLDAKIAGETDEKKRRGLEKDRNELQKARRDTIKSLEELTGTPEEAAEIAQQIAERKIQVKKIQDKINKAKENGDSLSSIAELEKSRDAIVDEADKLYNKSPHVKQTRGLEIQKRMKEMASERVKEIDEQISNMYYNDSVSAFGLPDLKDIPKLLKEYSDLDMQLADTQNPPKNAKNIKAKMDLIRQQLADIRQNYAGRGEYQEFLDLLNERELMMQTVTESTSAIFDIESRIDQGAANTTLRKKIEAVRAKKLKQDRENVESAKRDAEEQSQYFKTLAEETKVREEARAKQEQERKAEQQRQKAYKKLTPQQRVDKVGQSYDERISQIKRDFNQAVANAPEEDASVLMEYLDKKEQYAKIVSDLNEATGSLTSVIRPVTKSEYDNALQKSKELRQRINKLDAEEPTDERTLPDILNEMQDLQEQQRRYSELISTYKQQEQSRESIIAQQAEKDSEGNKYLSDLIAKRDALVKQNKSATRILESRASDVNATKQRITDIESRMNKSTSMISEEKRKKYGTRALDRNKEVLKRREKKYQEEFDKQSPIIKQTSAEIKDLNAEIEATQQYYLNKYLLEQEARIKEVRDQFISAVESNAPEQMILDLRNKLLSLYNDYLFNGGTSKFADSGRNVRLRDTDKKLEEEALRLENKIQMQYNKQTGRAEIKYVTDERTKERRIAGLLLAEEKRYKKLNERGYNKNRSGYIGDTTAIQYAQDYVPWNIQLMQEQKKKIYQEMEEARAKVESSKTASGQYQSSLISESQRVEVEINRMLEEKVHAMADQWIEEARNAGKINAKKYINEAMQLEKDLLGGDKEYSAAKQNLETLNASREQILSSDKEKSVRDAAVKQIDAEIMQNQQIVAAFDAIEARRQQLLQEIKNRGKEEPVKEVGKDVESKAEQLRKKTENELYSEIVSIQEEQAELEKEKADINRAIQNSRNRFVKPLEDDYKDTKRKLKESKPRKKSEQETIDSILSELDSKEGNLEKAKELASSGMISKGRLDLVNKLILLKETLFDEEQKIQKLEEQEASLIPQIQQKISDVEARNRILRQKQAGVGTDAGRIDLIVDAQKEQEKDLKKRFELTDEEESRDNQWRNWYYANMTEDEAILSKKISKLARKFNRGTADDAEKELLVALQQQAKEMGLEITNTGKVKSKVSYEDFMANPEKYSIPVITTEKAQAAGVTTKGTVSGATQQVSVTDPINVNTVGSVNSVNLGTIESLLSSIAAKIGADTSGIKLSAQGATDGGAKGFVPKYDYSDKDKSELNSILSSKKSTQDQIDAAALAALKMGKSLQLLDTGRYSIRNKSNGSIKTPEDYFRSRNITVKADEATVEPQKPSGAQKQTVSQDGKKKQRNYSNPLAALARQANDEYNAAKDEKERLEIKKKYVSQGVKLGKYTNTKGQERMFFTAGRGADEEMTNKFITENGLQVEIKVETEPESKQGAEKPKSSQTKGSQTKTSEDKPKEEPKAKPKRTAEELRKAYYGAKSQAEMDAIIKEAFESGYGVAKKDDGKYAISKKPGNKQVKDYDTYLQERVDTKQEKAQSKQPKEQTKKSEAQQPKTTREGAERLRTAIQNATSQQAVDAVIKEAFESGYGVNKKKGGYTVKKKADKDSLKDYEQYLAERQELDEQYFMKNLASQGNTKYRTAKTDDERKEILRDYVSRGLRLFEQEVPATDKNGKPKKNAGQKNYVLSATGAIKGTDVTEAFIKDNNIVIKVEVESKPQDSKPKQNGGSEKRQPSGSQNADGNQHVDYKKYYDRNNPDWTPSSYWAESSADSVRNGVADAIINWFKESPRGKHDIILDNSLDNADNLERLLAKKLGFTYDKVSVPQEDGREAHGYRIRPIDPNNVMSLDEIYKTLGSLNTSEKFGEFMSPDIFNQIVEQVRAYWQNTYDTAKKNLKDNPVNKDVMQDAVKRMQQLGFELQNDVFIKQNDETPDTPPNEPAEHRENAGAMEEEAQAAAEDAEAKKKLNAESQDGESSSEPETHRENADAMSEEAKEAQRLAKLKEDAKALADSYTDPDKLEKDIKNKQRILDNMVKKPETKEKYSAELSAMKERLEVLRPSPAVEQDTENLKENGQAAEEAAKAHEKLNGAMNNNGGDSGTAGNTEGLNGVKKAAEEADEAILKTMADVHDFKDAQDIIRQFLGDDFEFGNLVDFKASEKGFRYKGSEGLDVIYKETKDGAILKDAPQVERSLSLLNAYEKKREKIIGSIKAKDVSELMPEMFSGQSLDNIKKAQALIEKVQGQKDIFDNNMLEINIDELNKANADLNELQELLYRISKQKVGDVVEIDMPVHGLQTARQDLQAYFDTLDQGNASLVKFSNSNTEMVYTLRTADNMIETHSVALTKQGKMMDTLVSSEKYLNTFQKLIGGLGNKMHELFNYFVASTSIYEFINILRQGVNIVKEFDTALVEMRKVSDESVSTLKSFQSESFGMANSVGTTALQIQRSTADWMRLGESLDEAKESAKDATILLNVSEFSSIDDATQSLVSMSQAYKELDKIEIIDKLNNIGNNFSISTDQLAEGLQNAAAVLKTQGNDIDQSIALLTAGNAITQDVSKTSAGIRTIALRISGTEEAKDAIADMGEDVDDFVVRTRSKTDQIIRDYTAVASNMYQGVSVLDPNGNLRNTYDILLDISKIYKEIQAEDKANGTNRAQALVEQLAGKNRSNIAASILNNPEMLENVYRTSQQSQGSAQEELDKYLDSVEGKLQKVTNKIQEIATITFNSEGLKTLLDIAVALLGAFTKLLDVAGGLSGILGTLGGIVLQKNGFNIIKAFKDSGKVGAKSAAKSISKDLLGELQNVLTKNDLDLSIGDFITNSQSGFGTLSEEMQGVILKMRETYGESMKLSDGFVNMGKAGETAGGAFGKVKGILGGIASTLANVAISTAAVVAIGYLIQQVVDAINWKEIAVEKGKEAQKNISDIKTAYDEQKSFVTDSADEYTRLRRGVSTKGGQNKNVALSNEEYERYLSLNKEMASLFPSLVSGYDSQGNALLDLSSDTDTANKSLNELLETQRKISEYKIGKELPDAIKGAMTQIDDAYEELTEAQDNITDVSYMKEFMSGMSESVNSNKFTNFGVSDDYSTFQLTYDLKQSDLGDKIKQAYINAWKEAGVENISEATPFINADNEETVTISLDVEASTEEIEKFKDEFSAQLEEIRKLDVEDVETENQAIIATQTAEMAAIWSSLVPSLIGQMSLYDDYQKLGDLKVGEQLQKIIADDIANMDVTKLTDTEKESFIKTPRKFLREKFLQPLVDSITDKDTGELSDELASKVMSLFDTEGVTTDEFKKRAKTYLEGIFGTTEEGKQARYDYEVAIGLGFYNDPENKKDFEYYVNQELQDAQDIINGARQKQLDGFTDFYGHNIKQNSSKITTNIAERKRLSEQINSLVDTGGTNNLQKVEQLRQQYNALQKEYDKLIQNSVYYHEQLDNAQKAIPDYADQIETLDVDQIAAISKMKEAGEFDSGIPETWEEFVTQIDEFIKKTSNLDKPIDNLNTLFNNEEYANNAEKFKTALSSANSALESLRENGSLTADEMVTLQEAFPDLKEFTEESISDKALSNLSEWIKKIRSNMDGMSPEGIEQTNTYIKNLVESMGELADSSDDVKGLFMDMFAPENINNPEAQKERGRMSAQFDEQVKQLQSDLAERGEEIDWNVVYTMVADDSFSGTAEAILAKYDGYKVEWEIIANATKIEKELEHVAGKRSVEEAKLSRNETAGIISNSKSYDNIIKLDREDYDLREQDANNALTHWRKLVEQRAPEAQIKEALDVYNEKKAELYNSEGTLYTDLAKQTEAGVAELDDQIARNSNDITRYEQEVTENQKYRQKVSQKTAEELNRLHTEQAAKYDEEVSYWKDIVNYTGDTVEQFGVTRKYAAEKMNEASASAVNEREAAEQYTPQQNALNNLQMAYEDTADAISRKNEEISLKQAQGLKANVKDYKELAALTKKQIKNLQDQNAELRKSGNLTEDQQKTLRSNESTINDLYSSLLDYQDTAKNLAVSDAMQLASTISTAMSEMTSETGLTAETMRQITTGFSELGSAADISSIFYSTADGVKVDMMELQRLAEEQNKIVNQNFADEMSEIQEAMDRLEPNTDAFRQAQDELADLQRRQAQYLATYKEQMEAFTRLSAIARADQTKNEGADYETAQGYMKTAKEMYDKGLIGTDDFKTRAAYLDPYGRTDWKTFEQNYKKAERYFTDDSTGVKNFLNDLKSKGLATYDSLTGWALDFADTSKAALEMGMSEEFFTDVMTRLNDFGFDIQYVGSLEEASVKMKDLKNQIADARLEYAELVEIGADPTVLSEKQKQIEALEQSVSHLEQATNNYVEGSQKSFEEGFNNLPDVISNLKESYDKYMDSGDFDIADKFRKEIERLAEKYDVKLNADLSIDEESWKSQLDVVKGVEFGDVDFNRRGRVSGRKIQEFWPEFDGDYGTLYSQTATNEAGNVAIVATPILPNGEVLSQKDFDAYMDEALEGNPIEVPIVMARFTGENAQQLADQYAEVAHFHELLDNDKVNGYSDAISKYIHTLKQFSSDELGTIKFGDGEVQLEGAEQALDGILNELQLGQEYGEALLLVLSQIGQIDYTPETEYGKLDTTPSVSNRFMNTVEKQSNEALQRTIGNSQASQQVAEQEQRRLDIAEKIKAAYEDEDSSIHQVLDTLEGADNKTLSEIAFGDHETATGEAGKIETAIDGLLSEFGLAQEDGEMLIALLQLLNQTEVDIDTESNMEQTNEELETGYENLQKLINTGDIELSFSLKGDNSELSDDQLQQKRTELIRAQGKINPETDTYTAVTNELQGVEREIHIRTIIDGKDEAISGLEELKTLARENETELAKQFDININTEEGKQQLADLKQQILDMEDTPITVQIDAKQFDSLAGTIGDALTNPEITLQGKNQPVKDAADEAEQYVNDKHPEMAINAKNDEAKTSADEAETYAKNKRPIMQIGGNNSDAINAANLAVASINHRTATITVGANTTGITNALTNIMNQQYSISVHARVSGLPKDGPVAAGTFHAKASGTAYNVMNYRSMGAYAKGTNVSLDQDEYALTNEVGQESVVFLMPHYMVTYRY